MILYSFLIRHSLIYTNVYVRRERVLYRFDKMSKVIKSYNTESNKNQLIKYLHYE